MVVILVVLTTSEFKFSLCISLLLAKAIPVRGAKFRKARFLAGFLLFCTPNNHNQVYVPAAYRFWPSY